MIEYLPWSKKSFKQSMNRYAKEELSILDIELGGQCNYHCVYCDSPDRDRACRISINKIEEVLKTKQIDWVFICGLGEPTAKGNVDFLISILELCSKYNAKCSCFTNLSILVPKIKQFIQNGILHLLFKYDSKNTSVINDIYGTEQGNKQILNIEKVKELVKVENGCVNIAASIVPTQKNKNEIVAIFKDCLEHNIFPLIAELENSGSAQDCYNDLSLSQEELSEIKSQINEIFGEEYFIPICPAVICGMHVGYNGTVTLDSHTGLSCHWFWLEEPKTTMIGNFNEQDFAHISNKIIDYRKRKIDEIRKIYQNRNNLIFGGCGGDVTNILSKYIELIGRPKMIYLDNNATTQLSESVIRTIDVSKYLFANPSSLYSAGKEIRVKIEDARKNVASLINADNNCVIFTGSATESNNAVFHTCTKIHPQKRHIIISSIEHPSITKLAEYYEQNGYDITRLKVDRKGRLDIKDLDKEIRQDTLLVSIMLVNNEIGNIYPIKKIVQKIRAVDSTILIHTDAVQAIGKIEVDVKDLDVDFLSISGHKFHAPKGIGCLYIKKPELFHPFIIGGEQEGKLRGGTENTLSIFAIGQAAIETKENLKKNIAQITNLRDRMESKLCKIPGYTISIIGDTDNRVCNTSCISIDGFKGYELIYALDSLKKGICISAGSACNSKEQEPSSVMKSLGISYIPIRISLSRFSTKEEIDSFCKYILMILTRLKK